MIFYLACCSPMHFVAADTCNDKGTNPVGDDTSPPYSLKFMFCIELWGLFIDPLSLVYNSAE
jgi:hypothetical protein